MTGLDVTGGAATDLGSFVVTATPQEAAAFCAATGLAADGRRLPLTFPMRWMASPDVRAALLSLVPERDLVPFHEGQVFAYTAPLFVDTPYALRLEARRETAPDRLIATVAIAADDGTICATLETILRLFSIAAVAA